MEQNLKVSDIQNYYENCNDGLLVHGTVSTLVDDILKDGLLVREKSFPTVLSSNHGKLKDGTPITDYEWYEPRVEGENVSLVVQVPAEILKDIENKGLSLTQENIFDVICEDIELEVPDTEETREAYKKVQEEKDNHSKLDGLEGALGAKFSKYGEKPGTKYTHVGIPSKYICAITSEKQVYYASEQVQNYIKEQENIKKNNIKQEIPLTLDNVDEYF